MAKFLDRLVHAWNIFAYGEVQAGPLLDFGGVFSQRPDRPRLSFGNEKTLVASLYTKLSVDAASVAIRHVRVDDQGRFVEEIDSALNNCFRIEANIDQTPRQFFQSVYLSLFDEGAVAIVPTDTTINPALGSFDVVKMRVGKIVEWWPKHVKVRVYDENDGKQKEIVLPKKDIAIVENPFYQVMNEPNSTLKRLVLKLSLLDGVDEQVASGKLDLILQLPYVVKSADRRAQAERRTKDIETQLSASKYGVVWTDGTEKITQLNRPVENNLLAHITKLETTLYNQLGLSESIFDGTADEQTMLNYNNRTIEPIVSAVVDAMNRAFLTKTARTQKQTIKFFREPFKLVPVEKLAEIVDKFTRNEVMSSNEFRSIVGLKPSKDPAADELRNANLNRPEPGTVKPESGESVKMEPKQTGGGGENEV